MTVSDYVDSCSVFCHKGQGCRDSLYVSIEVLLFSIKDFHDGFCNKGHVEARNNLGPILIHQVQPVSVAVKAETIVIVSILYGQAGRSYGAFDNWIGVSLREESIWNDIHGLHLSSSSLEGHRNFSACAAI